MKNIETQRRMVALSLAAIISLNMSPLAFAETEVKIPEDASLSIEVLAEEASSLELDSLEEEVKEETKEVEVEETESNNYISSKKIETEIESLEIEGDLKAGTLHTIVANAKSENGALYKFYVKDLSTTKGNPWTVIQDYSEKSSATWTPEKGGKYWYGIHVKDKKSKEAKDTHLYIPIDIEGEEKTVLDSLEIEGNSRVDSPQIIKASGRSKNGLLYKFYVKDLSSTKGNPWTVIQDYSEESTATWTPKKDGNYWYGVHIKDKESNAAKEAHKYTEIKIDVQNPTEIESFEIEGGLEVNSPQILKASAVSANSPLYKFYIKDLSTNKWSVIQDYSSKNTATWKPTKTGKYWYGVHVKDSKSKAAKDTHKYKPINIAPLPPAKLEDFTIKGTGYEKQMHTLTAKGSSRNGVLYKFYVKDLSAKSSPWKVIQDYSTKNTANWKPQKAGKYWYGVHIKDKMSDNAKDVHLYTPITINPPVYYNVTEYDVTLEQALDKQVDRNTISKGGSWVKATKDEIRDYLNPDRFLQFKPESADNTQTSGKPSDNIGKIGIVNTSSLNVRSGPATNYDKIGTTLQGKSHKIMQESNGWYLIEIGGINGWISGDYVSFADDSKKENNHIISLEVTETTLNVRSEPNTTSKIIDRVSSGEVYVVLEEKNNWYKINVGGAGKANHGWVSGDYIKFINAVPRDMYQFMVLSGQCGVTVGQMNLELKGKGILEGKGSAFIAGSKKYNVNEIYLMAHSFLETGNGTSKLANGILVSSVDGKPVEPKVTYNMYGIGAKDKDANRLGSEYAYKQGWFTPEIAIREGGQWISENYINHPTYKQDTLYKMKFNIATPWHQYATDAAWAYKQNRQIELMMKYCRENEGYILKFDIPKYR